MLELIRRLAAEGILLNVQLEAAVKDKAAGLNVSGAPA
jgi:hypothetical protein